MRKVQINVFAYNLTINLSKIDYGIFIFEMQHIMKLKLQKSYRKTKKNVSFLFPDHQFDETCKQLEARITDLFCIVDKRGRVKFIPNAAIKILGYEINTKLQKMLFEMYGSYIINLCVEQNKPKDFLCRISN